MNYDVSLNLPSMLEGIESDTRQLDFPLASERATGALLRALAASKPGGRILELGTGTGLSACWMLDGMDEHAHLDSVDIDAEVQTIARKHLDQDSRVTFHLIDGVDFLTSQQGQQYDMVFPDAWPGKFSHQDLLFSLLVPGGIYVIDDMNPQQNWPDDHAPKVSDLVKMLENREDLHLVKLDWSSGIIVGVKEA
jgi:predicted O-methyltransferase YrrM